ncbi:hypothetical protein CF327_g1800 [Tilletia walkeri]|uniref:WD40 repeat-like protein n=1 Tax=Tilletia walkeri TaxID=117179 RepID=A0A8X7NHB2_9BASI|nr:hypothetical protein CF327_g1800 [Tilletia walkeri]KAE8272005.1 hypothetical protein A4X09_0g357 [Tilletia walkeri]
MAGKQRRQSQGEGGPSSSSGSGSGAGGRPTATVFRKSTKKARLDEASPNTRKPLPGKAAGVAEGKPPFKPKPKPPPQRTRPKDQPKPKTKHEFIQQKKAAALAEKEKEKAATAKKVAANAKAKAAKVSGPAQKGKGKAGKIKTPAVPPALVIPAPPPPASSFRIVTGSYERLLYGFQASLSPNPSADSNSDSSALSVTLKPYFIFPAHVSAIKTVACGPDGSRWLATGGTDELIKIWDLKKRVEVGALTGHEGTITSLSFPSRTFLISTGSDGRINIFRARDWALLRTLKGHTGSINSAAVHPSGRLALSVGKDRTIRMWDLMRAKGAASTKLGVEGETIRWDSRGERFVVLSSTGAGEGIVFRTDMTRLHMLEGIKRLHDVQFVRARMSRGGEGEDAVEVEHELMLVASEDKSVHVFDLDQSALEELEREQMKVKARAESKKGKAEGDVADDEDEEDDEDDAVPLVEIGRLVGHGNRVKAVAVQHVIVPTAASESTSTLLSTTLLATTISSDGLIRVFDLARLLHIRSTSSSDSKTVAAEAVPELEAIASHDTKGSRLTCLSIAPGGGKSAVEQALADKGKKRALSDEDEDDDDDAADAGEEGDPFLDSDVGSESAVDTEDEDDEDDEDEDDDVDLEAEAEELARLEKEIEEAKKLGLEIPSDFEEEDDEEDDEDMESFDEDEEEVDGEEEDEGEDEEEE